MMRWSRRLGTGLVAVVALSLGAACGEPGSATQPTGTARPASPSDVRPDATPTARKDATPTPVPTSTIDLRITQVLWNQLPDPRAIIFEDEHSQRMREVRIVRLDGSVVASAAFRKPQPGEPRTCGHPDSIRPQVAVVQVSSEVMSEFKEASVFRPSVAGTPLKTMRVEIRQDDGIWNVVPNEMLLYRPNQAGGPCFQ